MPSTSTRMMVRLKRTHPVRLVLLGYLSYVVIGWLLLCLPFTWEPGQRVGALDALFISCSAVSTTGLATVNTPLAFSFWGELVVLGLVQLGGLGYMTMGSFVIIAGSKRFSNVRRGVTYAAFALPDGFDPRRFVRHVVLFTFAVEAAGAVLLYPAFASAGAAERAAAGEIGASFSGPLHVAWQSVFHSVSAFCTAGFSLYPDSLEAYAGNVWINAVIAALSVLGAVGFIVMTDVFHAATRPRHRLCLTSKIILSITAWFILVGALLLFLDDPGLKQLPAERRILVALFQSMSSATTVGFDTYPIGEFGLASVFVLYFLMIVGASPSGTGGGLKSTSVSALIATVRSILLNREEVTFFGKIIPRYRLHTAFAALAMYVVTLGIGCYLLLLTESRAPAPDQSGVYWSLEDLIFEAVSALGTVGLSRGVTSELTDLGKLVVIALMFAGRLGPLTLGLAFFSRPDRDPLAAPEPEDVAI